MSWHDLLQNQRRILSPGRDRNAILTKYSAEHIFTANKSNYIIHKGIYNYSRLYHSCGIIYFPSKHQQQRLEEKMRKQPHPQKSLWLMRWAAFLWLLGLSITGIVLACLTRNLGFLGLPVPALALARPIIHWLFK